MDVGIWDAFGIAFGATLGWSVARLVIDVTGVISTYLIALLVGHIRGRGENE